MNIFCNFSLSLLLTLCLQCLAFPSSDPDPNPTPIPAPPPSLVAPPPSNVNADPPSSPTHDSKKTPPGLRVNVPNPNSNLDQDQTNYWLNKILKDPLLQERFQQYHGSSIDDINADTSSGCISSGSRFPTINLKHDHEQEESDEHDDADVKKVWRNLKVNRLYGVIRDRFFAQNLEGGSMHLKGEAKTAATIHGTEDDWNSEYVLAKADAFWSMDNNFGAQHSIGMQTYPFELQLVHFRKDLNSLTEAAQTKHGILVMSILFEATGKPNPSMEPLAAAALMSIFPSSKMHVVHGPLDIKSLFPYDLSNLQYTGAYMAHPCSREAKWVVFQNTRQIAHKQLKNFREIRESGGRKNPGVFLSTSQKDASDIDDVHISKDIRLKILTEETINQSSSLKKPSYIFVFFLAPIFMTFL